MNNVMHLACAAPHEQCCVAPREQCCTVAREQCCQQGCSAMETMLQHCSTSNTLTTYNKVDQQ